MFPTSLLRCRVLPVAHIELADQKIYSSSFPWPGPPEIIPIQKVLEFVSRTFCIGNLIEYCMIL